MSVYAVTYIFAADSETVRERTRPQHRAFLDQALADGMLLMAGPLGAPAASGALLLVEADNEQDALHAVAADPYRSAGAISAVRAQPMRVTRLAVDRLAAHLPGCSS